MTASLTMATHPVRRDLESLTDNELVCLAQADDSQALGVLISRYRDKAYQRCFGILRDHEAAGEALQEAFLSVARSYRRFRRESMFSTWLYRIVTNAALMHLRRQKSKRPGQHLSLLKPVAGHTEWLVELLPGPWQSPEERFEADEFRQVVLRAYNTMPHPKRQALALFMSGMSNVEAARLTEITVPAHKSRLYGARAVIRRALTAYQEGKPSRAS